MSFSQIIRISLLFWLVVLVGCSNTNSNQTASLEERIQVHLSRVFEAHAAAESLWDRVLEGEFVSCEESFDRPPTFSTMQGESDAAPLSVPIQEAMNAAIIDIQTMHDLWESECQREQSTISIVTVGAAQQLLTNAEQSLLEAASAWYVWQP